MRFKSFITTLCPERAVFYASRLHASQLQKGNGHGELEPLICIHILLFNLFDDTRALRQFSLLDTQTYQPLCDHLTLSFLELKKIIGDNKLDERVLDWGRFIQNPEKERLMLEQKESFKDAYKELERLSRDPDKRWAYEMAFKAIKDEEVRLIDMEKAAQMRLDKATRKGLEKGLQQGLNGAMKTLYQKGFTVEQIATLYDVSEESVEQAIRQ